MKADPKVQLRLLDLQAIDTRLQQIAHRRDRLPEDARLAEATSALRLVEEDLVRAETVRSDVRRELERAEGDVRQVRDRAERDQSRLDSGAGSAKDLTALQHELATLGRRQAALEEVELEVMERAEAAEQRVAAVSERREAAARTVSDLTAQRDAALAELDREHTEVSGPRAEVAAGIDERLLALYERVRDSSGGLGAAALRARRCGGCRLELNSVELGAIAKAAPEEVLRCEECQRVLVRTPESGLPA